MTLSPLQKSFSKAVCLTSAVFGAAVIPLALYGPEPVEVEVRNQQVFAAELSSVAAPYLTVAGLCSAALGLGVLGLSGWTEASKASKREQEKAAELQKDLLSYKAELERIKFSDSRLEAQSLNSFLPPVEQPSAVPAPVETPAPAPAVEAPAIQAPATAVQAAVAIAAAAPQPTLQQPEPEFKTVMDRLEQLASQANAPQPAAPAAQGNGGAVDGQFDMVLSQLRELATQVEHIRVQGDKKVTA